MYMFEGWIGKISVSLLKFCVAGLLTDINGMWEQRSILSTFPSFFCFVLKQT